MVMKREDEDDLLAGGPPSPKLKNAKSGSSSSGSSPISIPRGSKESSAAAASILGNEAVTEVTEAMATIEMMIKQMGKHVPAILQEAQPFIARMRDMGMAGLADLAQGGTGAVDMLGAGGTPPPMAAMPGGGAPGAGMPPIMPMPPM